MIHSLMKSPHIFLLLVCCASSFLNNTLICAIALHPYFKLAYIKLVWGGLAEQEAECKAGNQFAKDWHDKARSESA